MAFAAENYRTLEVKSDKRYVQWLVKFDRFVDDEYFTDWYPLNPCTEEEFKRFYPPEESSAAKV